MPLAAPALKTLMKTKLDAAYGPPADPAEQTKFLTALSEAIVEYLVANTLVTGAVTSGLGAGGTVTGTIT